MPGSGWKKSAYDHELNALRNYPKRVVMLAVDLNGDNASEYVLLSNPQPVFAREPDGWQQIGQVNFVGDYRD